MQGSTEKANRKDELDVLQLPPRSEVHDERGHRRGSKLRIRHPVVRILSVLFISLPIMILSFKYYMDNKKKEHPISIKFESKEFEQIFFDTKKVVSQKVKAEQPMLEEKKMESVNENEKQPEPFLFHTVQEGETMYTISMKYFNSRNGERLIREANGLSSNTVQPGQVLKIPKEKAAS